MVKDDELKIDISDLFGDDLAEARAAIQSAEVTPLMDEAGSVPVTPRPDESLNVSSLEMEKEGEASAASSPIDFDAPMPRPFSTESPQTVDAGVLIGKESAQQLQRHQIALEYFIGYEEYRSQIFMDLAPLVGERKANTMLARTVELARTRHPEVFKNANWDWEGNLIDTGFLDSQRMTENHSTLPLDRADAMFDQALYHLMDVRLKAVEKGLGTGMRSKVKARILGWIEEKIQQAIAGGRDPEVFRRLRALIPT
jgi:hypothetical protein